MIFKKSVLLVFAFLMAFAFSGCTKKPRRPNPLDTVVGQSGGAGAGMRGDSSFDPQSMGGEAGLYGLESRSGAGDTAWTDQAEAGLLPTIYFAFDSSSIQTQERSKLDEVAEYLNSNPRARVVVEGHCDWRGTTEYNLALGDRRAESVQNYLQNLGIAESRLVTRSKGDLEATEGANSAQMARERKVELLVAR